MNSNNYTLFPSHSAIVPIYFCPIILYNNSNESTQQHLYVVIFETETLFC